MKNNLRILTFGIFALVLLAFSTSAYGQGYRKGEVTLAPGFGAGSVGGYFGYYSFPLVGNLEVGFSDIISGGGFVAVRISGIRNCSSCGTIYSPVIGARVSGHLFPILEKFGVNIDPPEKADVYLTILTGYEIDNDNLTTNDFIWPRPVIGGKWYFADAFGVWAEVGYGALAYGNIGLVFRFGGQRN